MKKKNLPSLLACLSLLAARYSSSSRARTSSSSICWSRRRSTCSRNWDTSSDIADFEASKTWQSCRLGVDGGVVWRIAGHDKTSTCGRMEADVLDIDIGRIDELSLVGLFFFLARRRVTDGGGGKKKSFYPRSARILLGCLSPRLVPARFPRGLWIFQNCLPITG